MKKGQIVYVHGGSIAHTKEDMYAMLRTRSFDPFDERQHWFDDFYAKLSGDYDIIKLIMPNKQSYDYTAWSIWFERTFPYLTGERVILIGESLGGLFVTKYLCDHSLPVQLDQLHLVAPVFDGYYGLEEGVGAENMHDTALFSNLLTQTKAVYCYGSMDDPTMPALDEIAKYQQHLPDAIVTSYADKGHFFVPEFPDLIANIKTLA